MCNLQPCTLALQYTSARRDNKQETVTKYSGTQLCLLPQSSRRFVLFHSLFSLQPPTLAMISLASNILLPVVAISFHVDILTKKLLKWVTIIIRYVYGQSFLNRLKLEWKKKLKWHNSKLYYIMTYILKCGTVRIYKEA